MGIHAGHVWTWIMQSSVYNINISILHHAAWSLLLAARGNAEFRRGLVTKTRIPFSSSSSGMFPLWTETIKQTQEEEGLEMPLVTVIR